MAITQPAYPVETNALVTHVGSYTDARETAEATARDTAISTHSADTTSVHGIADTSALATDAEVATAVSNHAADETAVHGISDANLLVGYNLFNGTSFPARPDFNVVLWVGGGSADDPTASMNNGDVWFPSEA